MSVHQMVSFTLFHHSQRGCVPHNGNDHSHTIPIYFIQLQPQWESAWFHLDNPKMGDPLYVPPVNTLVLRCHPIAFLAILLLAMRIPSSWWHDYPILWVCDPTFEHGTQSRWFLAMLPVGSMVERNGIAAVGSASPNEQLNVAQPNDNG